ncbi:MAG TPA: class I SAM-dependent methyltransferase [Acidimicrobiia bacterium]|nr:class I SAM-dependent methyltransferase [Acidimicrobiia bacterium]
MSDNWDDIAAWWRDESAKDPSYPNDVLPLLEFLLDPKAERIIDLGCGDGALMRGYGGNVVGVDLSFDLARTARSIAPVVVAELPDLGFLRTDSFDAAVSVYLLDLIEDHEAFFASAARICRSSATLVVVINHPVFTAPGSAPLLDEDGEVLWRWGNYLSQGSSLEPAGHREIRYHHRPLGRLLTSAAEYGWRLEVMAERPLSEETIRALPGYAGQQSIPRLLGVRWRLDEPARSSQ